MICQQVGVTILVVHSEPVDHGGTGLVQADHLDLRTFTTELQHHLVQRADRGDVPEMRTAHVDAHQIDHFLEVECVDETIGGLLPILGTMAFTGELTLRYRAPCPMGVPLEFRAWLVERDGRRFWFGDFFVMKALSEMIPVLDAASDPGDRLIVGPADLSRTIYSDVSVYWDGTKLVTVHNPIR